MNTRFVVDVDSETIACWKINYGLDIRSPDDAGRWWHDHNNGQAPAGAVAALGVALNEIARLRAAAFADGESDRENDSENDRENDRENPCGGPRAEIAELRAEVEEITNQRDDMMAGMMRVHKDEQATIERLEAIIAGLDDHAISTEAESILARREKEKP